MFLRLEKQRVADSPESFVSVFTGIYSKINLHLHSEMMKSTQHTKIEGNNLGWAGYSELLCTTLKPLI